MNLTGIGQSADQAAALMAPVKHASLSGGLLARQQGEFGSKALHIMMLAARRERVEVWRQFKAQCEGTSGSRAAGKLRLEPIGVLAAPDAGGKGLLEILAHGERNVTQYQLASGETIPHGILVATIMENALEEYRDMLNVPMGAWGAFHYLCGYSQEWLRATRSYSELGLPKTGGGSALVKV